jgi:prepilin-type processing-associated H-X9-DG protein
MNGGTINLGRPAMPTNMDEVPGFVGWIDIAECNGVVCQRSEYRITDIRDGTSNTYLIGEKNVNPDCYTTYSRPGDSQSMYNGWDEDNTRYGGVDTHWGNPIEYPLTPDTPGVEAHQCFGGPHPGVCQFVFCDGSVRSISYLISLTLHHNLASRNDGAAVTEQSFP